MLPLISWLVERGGYHRRMPPTCWLDDCWEGRGYSLQDPHRAFWQLAPGWAITEPVLSLPLLGREEGITADYGSLVVGILHTWRSRQSFKIDQERERERDVPHVNLISLQKAQFSFTRNLLNKWILSLFVPRKWFLSWHKPNTCSLPLCNWLLFHYKLLLESTEEN